MTSYSAKNPIPALGGFNPDYYAETASIAENIGSSSSPSRPSRDRRDRRDHNSSSSGGQGRTSRPQQQQQQQQTSNPSYAPPPQRPHSSSGAYQQRPPQQQQHAPQESGYGPTLTVPPPGYYATSPSSPTSSRPPSRPSQSQSQNYDDGGYYGNGDNIPPQNPPRPSSWSSSGPNGGGNNNGGPGGGAISSSSSPLKTSLSERLHQWGVKAGVPINKLTNKLGSEAFWPSTMDQECDKAARILQSFCKDGFYKTPTTLSSSSSSSKPPSPLPGGGSRSPALVKIPASVIQSALGLAIFTTFRTGLHISGAGGSGVVVARLPSGEWSPPSGFLVHTLGAGLMVGLDIYDCVCVLRTREAVRAFMRPGRLSLGGELALAAGPIGLGTSVEAAVVGVADAKPVWSYMKSRGFYAGLQADGTVVIARPDANAAFYGARLTPGEILAGNVPRRNAGNIRDPKMWPEGARRLMEALRFAEGRRDIDGGGVVRGTERRLLLTPTPTPTRGDLGREREREMDRGRGVDRDSEEDDYEYERRWEKNDRERERERSKPRERRDEGYYRGYEETSSERRRERSSRRSERRREDEDDNDYEYERSSRHERERSSRRGERGERRERY